VHATRFSRVLLIPLVLHTKARKVLMLDLYHNEGTLTVPFKCVDLESRIGSAPTVELSRIYPVVIIDLNN
jgi:hypothetical protein